MPDPIELFRNSQCKINIDILLIINEALPIIKEHIYSFLKGLH